MLCIFEPDGSGHVNVRQSMGKVWPVGHGIPLFLTGPNALIRAVVKICQNWMDEQMVAAIFLYTPTFRSWYFSASVQMRPGLLECYQGTSISAPPWRSSINDFATAHCGQYCKLHRCLGQGRPGFAVPAWGTAVCRSAVNASVEKGCSLRDVCELASWLVPGLYNPHKLGIIMDYHNPWTGDFREATLIWGILQYMWLTHCSLLT